MFAFTLAPFPLTNHLKQISHTSSRTCALRTTRFRGASLQITPPYHQVPPTYSQTQTPKCFSEPPENDGDDDEDEDEEQAEIILTDLRTNRTLSAGVEHTINQNDKTYVLCFPMDDPVFFARASDSGVLDPIEDDALVQNMFPTAEAVLAEDHIALKNSAYVMTIDDQSEDLDDDDTDDDDEVDDAEGAAEGEEQDVEIIGEFLHESVSYFVVRPMEAVLLVAEAVSSNGYRVVEGDDLDRVSPAIEKFIETLDVATA